MQDASALSLYSTSDFVLQFSRPENVRMYIVNIMSGNVLGLYLSVSKIVNKIYKSSVSGKRKETKSQANSQIQQKFY